LNAHLVTVTPVPDTSTRTAARHWAGGDRLRQKRTNELVDYLWGSARPPEVLHRTAGFALRVPGRNPVPDPSEIPAGSLHLYPRYLLFVGASRELGQPLPGPGPVRLGAQAYSGLSASERARLQEPLRRAGSLVVPLDDVSEVAVTRWLGSPCIELHTADELFRIGPHPSTDSPSVTRSTRWEPRLATLLESYAGRYASDKAALATATTSR
jgi:hypothetical protein